MTKILPASTYNATHHRAACVQGFDHLLPQSEVWNAPGELVAEDCLHMNIWLPVTAEQDTAMRAESEQASPNHVVSILNKIIPIPRGY
jgi:hypothetical protein